MRTHTKTAIVALITSIALAFALTATTATARNFSSSERELEFLYRELRFQTSSNTISCPVTLLGHFIERTIPKIVGTQVGIIRHVTPTTGTEPSPCTGGSITILNSTLPWNINYQGFTGRLPNIESIRFSVIRLAFRIRTSNGIGCLAGTTTAEPFFAESIVNRTTGRVEGFRADESRTIRLGGGFLCSLAGTSSFSGTGIVTNLPGAAAVTVTLI